MKLSSIYTTTGFLLSTLISINNVYADDLVTIYKLAAENDSTLRISKATYRSEREAEIQTRSALRPQVSIVGTTSDTHRDIGDLSAVELQALDGNDGNGNNHGFRASVNQTVLNLEQWYSHQQAKKNKSRIKAIYSLEKQNLILRVATAYFDVLRSIDNLASAKAEEKAIARQLEQTQQRFDVGLIAITDVHEARAGYDSVVVSRLELEGALAINYEALEVLTGQPHANLTTLAELFPIQVPEPVAREGWVKIALENSLEIQSAEHAVNAARANTKAKRFSGYPTLDASATHDHNTDRRDTTTYQLSLTAPLYTGGLNSSRKRQAFEQLNLANETVTNAKRGVIQKTRSAYLSVTTDIAKVKARKQSITSRQSALDATQAGYEVGTRNIVDVLAAQRDLYQALRNYANARYDYVIDMLKLKKEAGVLNVDDIHEINKGLVTASASLI